jgi:hypothetical protein
MPLGANRRRLQHESVLWCIPSHRDAMRVLKKATSKSEVRPTHHPIFELSVFIDWLSGVIAGQGFRGKKGADHGGELQLARDANPGVS